MVGIPDLSPKGWVTNPLEKADKLMAHFYAAEYSQTNLFPNDIASFTYILQKNLNNPLGLEEDLRNELRRYFSRYFDEVNVEVKVKDSLGSGSKQIVEFSLRFQQDGKDYDLTDIKDLNHSDFEKYYTYNNTGVLK